jgi:methylmalonyl-CoA/ethylmalonyl-CoA epimerase
MNVNKIDHICIAVKNLDEARKQWEPLLGKPEPDDPYVDEPSKIRVARYILGDVGFELMEDLTGDGDVAKFIEKRGEGIMLIGLNVDSARQAIDEARDKGYPIISDPAYGDLRPFRDCEYGFVHPRATNGVLLEFIDYKWDELKREAG